jgi:hypothetical protein
MGGPSVGRAGRALPPSHAHCDPQVRASAWSSRAQAAGGAPTTPHTHTSREHASSSGRTLSRAARAARRDRRGPAAWPRGQDPRDAAGSPARRGHASLQPPLSTFEYGMCGGRVPPAWEEQITLRVRIPYPWLGHYGTTGGHDGSYAKCDMQAGEAWQWKILRGASAS